MLFLCFDRFVCVWGEEGWWEVVVLCFDRFVLFSLGLLSLFVGFVFTDSALFLNIFECFWNVLYVFRCYLYVLIALYCFLYLLDLFTYMSICFLNPFICVLYVCYLVVYPLFLLFLCFDRFGIVFYTKVWYTFIELIHVG